MKFDLLKSTAAFGTVVVVATMGLFLNGASVLDLGDFSALDQKIITKEAPRQGGIVLMKEDTVVRNTQRGPILTAVSGSTEGTYYDYNNITPAAGGSMRAVRPDALPLAGPQPAESLSGRTVPPVAARGIGGPNDSATDPTDPYAQVQARLQAAGVPSLPEPGSAHATAEIKAGVTPLVGPGPLVNTLSTESMASNSPVKANSQTSVQSLTEIAPAAGGTAQSSGRFNK